MIVSLCLFTCRANSIKSIECHTLWIFIPQGYAPLYDSFEQFYLNYVYRRIRDCFNRPICSVPGDEVTLKDRVTNDNGWTFE